jgi:N-acetylmuramoyl-L-alanine amidase
MELLNYLFKVSACLMLFFAFYLLVLKKLTFFKINRFYLLAALFLSFAIPTLQFTIEREVAQISVAENPIALQDVDLGGPAFQAPITLGSGPIEPQIEPFNWFGLLPYTYGAIVAILLLLTIWRLYQLLKHTNSNTKNINGLKIVAKSQGFTNCSFFNYVFVDQEKLTEKELNVLLKHEEVHAKQFHSIDKIVMMITKAILWFNPIIYFYDKELEQIHEFEADEATSADFGTYSYASLLLRLAVEKGNVPLVHNFVKSPIKARIKMLFHTKSKNMKKLIYMLTLPIGMMLIWGFTVDIIDVLPSQSSQEKQFTLVLDAGHGGKNSGTQVNGFSEKNISLSMAKKIRAIAEAKGIKVVLTRSNDEYLSWEERVKTNGTVLLSLHVNSAPSPAKNGIEMFTGRTFKNKDGEPARSMALTYHLYRNIKNATGIEINNKPFIKNLLILDKATMPSVLLEMGYLSNKNDFQYITNSQKQDELAKLIVDGIIDYQQKTPSAEDQAKFQKSANEFNIKYTAWKNSGKYKSLIAETKKFKAQTLVGHIRSLNYFQRGGTPDLDGFIVNANNKTYRVYLTKEQLKAITYKVGDQISFYAHMAEVWFDSEYPVVKPKKVTITPVVSVALAKINPVLISSSSLIADTKTNILYIKNGKIEIGDSFLEAEDLTWDKNNMLISAKKGTVRAKDGNVITGENLIYNLNTGSYNIDKTSGKVEQIKSSVYELLDKLPYNASDSVRISKNKNTITLYGKASINLNGTTLKGDRIEINKMLNIVTAYNGILIGVDKQQVKAKVISYDILTKIGVIKDINVI